MMDAERRERAARDLRAEALRYFTLRGLLPTEGIVRAAIALDEALAAPEPAQAVEAVALEAARFMVAKVTDVCNKIDRDLKNCDGPVSERRRLDTLARGAMAVWAALDESVVREAVSHALRAQQNGGAP